MSNIEVMAVKHYSKGALRAFADIYIPKMGLEIRGISLFAKGPNKWANLPSKEYQDESGATKYSPIVRFREDDVYKTFRQQLVEAIVEYCAANNIDLDATSEQVQSPLQPVQQQASVHQSNNDGMPF